MTKRVLVIDDDATLARLMGRVLDYPELAVTAVGSLADARANIALLGRPDVIVADVRLPNGDGRHLREELSDVPFIVISGFPETDVSLMKPFTSRQLRMAVGQAVGLTLGDP